MEERHRVVSGRKSLGPVVTEYDTSRDIITTKCEQDSKSIHLRELGIECDVTFTDVRIDHNDVASITLDFFVVVPTAYDVSIFVTSFELKRRGFRSH